LPVECEWSRFRQRTLKYLSKLAPFALNHSGNHHGAVLDPESLAIALVASCQTIAYLPIVRWLSAFRTQTAKVARPHRPGFNLRVGQPLEVD
jgi:hypothetical protein